MSPDFYIRKRLKIEYIGGYVYCELKQERGYFSEVNVGCIDSDDEEDIYIKKLNEKLYIDMLRLCLTPRKSVIIYIKNNFINKKLEEKYLPIIQNKLNKNNIDISQVIQVSKFETRYEV